MQLDSEESLWGLTLGPLGVETGALNAEQGLISLPDNAMGFLDLCTSGRCLVHFLDYNTVVLYHFLIFMVISL